MENLTEKEVTNILEDLVHQRFSIESLKKHLEEKFGASIELEDVTRDKDDCDSSDHNIMFNLDARGIFCDGDVYFLMLRQPDYLNNSIYVTEVGYEFG
jgi:hypothetical protein